MTKCAGGNDFNIKIIIRTEKLKLTSLTKIGRFTLNLIRRSNAGDCELAELANKSITVFHLCAFIQFKLRLFSRKIIKWLKFIR